MTKEETKQFNIRISASLYDEIKSEADKQSVTMTEYVIDKITDDSSGIDSSYKDRYVEQLQNEIDRQIKAIQKKDEHIQELTRLFDQQQQLTLQSNRQIEQLQLTFTQENNEPAETKTDEQNPSDRDQKQTEHPESKQKKGIFSRLFNR